jgi:FKBP-type peptidyl-prolyl cis-trans isomerase
MKTLTLAIALLLSTSAYAGIWPGDTEETGSWKKLAQGVALVDLSEGSGPPAEVGARVSVHYTGMLSDGTVFDSSVDRGVPFEFRIGDHQVIRGWEDGVVGASVGTKRRLIIPASQGYGDRATGPIPPGSTLYFEIEVLGIVLPRRAPTQMADSDPGDFRSDKSGLLLHDLQVGDGRKPVEGERVCVDYHGWVDGQLVEHTYARESCQWFRYEEGKVIDGLYLAVSKMKEGGVRQVRVPPELGHGKDHESIPEHVTVMYEITLVEARPKSN